MGIESVLTGGLTSASSGLSWFFPVLAAALVYFEYEVMDNEAPPINIPSEVLLPSYDFIVIGSGSAGMFFLIDRYYIFLFRLFLRLQPSEHKSLDT